jgi:LysR family transcriptional regulator, glycine cleavage system transcriptional activator
MSSRPPIQLNALRAFEAAARRGSVKEAALELNVSASAVSHHIRQLEALLGSSLFERTGRGVELTEDGAKLLPKLAQGFGLITEAVAELHARTALGPLRISVLEIFAHYWLSPRIRTYPLGRKGFDLSIAASQRVVSFETENVDLAIRLGDGEWPNLECEHLFDERLGVYASLQLHDPAPPIFVSRHREDEWNAWRGGARPPAAADAPVVMVETASLAMKAAIDGAGYCLAGDVFTALEVAAGRLRLCEPAPGLSDRGGYWLVHPRGAGRDPRVRNFRAWLLDQVAEAAPLTTVPGGDARQAFRLGAVR